MQARQPDDIHPPASQPKRKPRLLDGIAPPRYNSWKHGVTAVHVVIDDVEDPKAWDAHVKGTMESLRPEGHMEFMLVERIAIALWKLRRLDRWLLAEADAEYEYAVWWRDRNRDGPAMTEIEKLQVKANKLFPSGKSAALVIRYEAHFHRLYIQALHELEAMQERRKGHATPLARVDITGAPAS